MFQLVNVDELLKGKESIWEINKKRHFINLIINKYLVKIRIIPLMPVANLSSSSVIHD